jgi:hypothetical protein
MIEILATLLLYVVLGLLIGKSGLFFNSSSSDTKSNITRIDDKNWIVNNKFVSFEEDTPILRLEQEQEDTKHYRGYERAKLSADRERIGDEYLKTIFAIQDHSDLKDCVTEEKLLEITKKYEEYTFMCGKLKEDLMVLTKEEFLIRQENPIYCASFKMNIMNPMASGCYMIHNEKTAKYAGGNVNEMIAAEFKEKWY